MQRLCCVVVVALCVRGITSAQVTGPAQSNPACAALPLEAPTFTDAQSLFYCARYEAAAALTLALRAPDTEDPASYELRSSALLFQLKALLEGRPDKEDALKRCETCPVLIAEFLAEHPPRAEPGPRDAPIDSRRRSRAVLPRQAGSELRLDNGKLAAFLEARDASSGR